MKRIKYLWTVGIFVLMMVLAIGCSGGSTSATTAPNETTSTINDASVETSAVLPEQISWSTFGVGSSTYVQAASIADALTTKLGVKIRIVPADTSVGRIQGVLNHDVDYTLTADGAYFASYGLYDYASLELGPTKNLRSILARPGSTTVVTTEKTEVSTPKDFKDKRLVWIPGATSVNIKSVAFLAFADLTLDDVTLVTAPSYKAGVDLIKNGEADLMIGQVTSSHWYELDSMGLGVKFIEFPKDDAEGWERLQKITPWLYPGFANEGVGFNQPIEIPNYVNPLFVTTTEKSSDEVYNLVKAMDETYAIYKDVDPTMADWAIDKSSRFPVQCPYHEGAIKYFKEKGLWTEDHEAWNNKYLEELDKVSAAWVDFKAVAQSEGYAENEIHDKWIEKLKETIGRDFPENYDK